MLRLNSRSDFTTHFITAEPAWPVTGALPAGGQHQEQKGASGSDLLLRGTQRTWWTFWKMPKVINAYCKLLRKFTKKQGGKKEGKKDGLLLPQPGNK